MLFKKEKIRETLSNGIGELEQAKNRVRKLEQEKDDIYEELIFVNENNNKLQSEIDKQDLLIQQYERDLNDYPRKVNDCGKLKNENENIANKLIDLKKKYDVIMLFYLLFYLLIKWREWKNNKRKEQN